MAVVNGNDMGIYIGGSLIGCLTNATFSSTNETIEVTCKDNDGARQTLSGGNTSVITFEGFFNPAATYQVSDIIPLHQNKTLINWHFGDNTNLTFHGEGYIDVLDFAAPVNAGTTFSGTINVSGAWTYSET